MRIYTCAYLSVRAFVACAFMTVRFCLCGIVVCAFVRSPYKTDVRFEVPMAVTEDVKPFRSHPEFTYVHLACLLGQS
jgi:hypothetical protein